MAREKRLVIGHILDTHDPLAWLDLQDSIDQKERIVMR
jgi:hypothetical protein